MRLPHSAATVWVGAKEGHSNERDFCRLAVRKDVASALSVRAAGVQRGTGGHMNIRILHSGSKSPNKLVQKSWFVEC